MLQPLNAKLPTVVTFVKSKVVMVIEEQPLKALLPIVTAFAKSDTVNYNNEHCSKQLFPKEVTLEILLNILASPLT